MKLSVVIVNYNVKHFLEQVLHSVRKASEGLDVEVFVVDNNSVDGSVEVVEQKFPEVTLIANKENLGFSAANNQAIKLSKGEYVLLLNPDTIVEEDTFSKVIDFMDTHPDAGAMGVKMIDGKGKFLPESKRGLPTPQTAFYKVFGLSKLFPKSKIFGKYHLGYLDKDETHEIDVLSGAFMLLRKKVLDEIGLLDETFFMYGEDIDLSYRVTQAGYKNYYFPDTTIIHYKGESTKRRSANYVFVFYRAMIIFAKKHYSGKNAGLLSFLINCAIYLRAGMAIMIRVFNSILLPLTDAALIAAGMFFIKSYWEHNIKFVEGGKYPPEFMYVYVPAYIFVWLFSVYLSGGYEQNGGLKRIIRGLFVGTVTIAVGYAFLSEDYRNSRALILLGAIWAALSMIGLRIGLHLLKRKNLRIGEQVGNNTIIVGSTAECNRVLDLLTKADAPNVIMGFVTADEDDKGDNNYLGNVSQLEEIVDIYQVEEVIFCSKDLASNEIIGWMAATEDRNLQYRIVPEESMYVIGSHSRDSNAELYSIEIKLAISEHHNRRMKRIFDVVLALILIPLIPINLIIMKGHAGIILNISRVLWGKRTWVGYANHNHEGLPKLREGILSPVDELDNKDIDSHAKRQLNLLYAKNYTLEKDINIIFRGYRSLAN